MFKNSTKRQFWVPLFVVLMLALATSACGGEDPATISEADKKAAQGTFEKMMDEYERTAQQRGATLSDDFLGAFKELSRQFIGNDLPPQEWRPTYGDYLNIGALSGANRNIPFPPGIAGTRLTFKGTGENPFTLLINLQVWDGAIVNDPEYGVLLSPGTNFKQIRMKQDRRMMTIGHINENWEAVVDKEWSVE